MREITGVGESQGLDMAAQRETERILGAVLAERGYLVVASGSNLYRLGERVRLTTGPQVSQPLVIASPTDYLDWLTHCRACQRHGAPENIMLTDPGAPYYYRVSTD